MRERFKNLLRKGIASTQVVSGRGVFSGSVQLVQSVVLLRTNNKNLSQSRNLKSIKFDSQGSPCKVQEHV